VNEVWTAITATAAVIAAVGAVGALLATTLQLHQERLAREVDYYRKLTPFLSFEVSVMAAPTGTFGQPVPLAVEVYADGGGYAFNMEANIDQTNASVGGGARLSGQKVIRYLREGSPSPGYIDFSKAAEGFHGELKVKFIDTFGIKHEAHQPRARWRERQAGDDRRNQVGLRTRLSRSCDSARSAARTAAALRGTAALVLTLSLRGPRRSQPCHAFAEPGGCRRTRKDMTRSAAEYRRTLEEPLGDGRTRH
jgi:hypothetical protein